MRDKKDDYNVPNSVQNPFSPKFNTIFSIFNEFLEVF